MAVRHGRVRSKDEKGEKCADSVILSVSCRIVQEKKKLIPAKGMRLCFEDCVSVIFSYVYLIFYFLFLFSGV